MGLDHADFGRARRGEAHTASDRGRRGRVDTPSNEDFTVQLGLGAVGFLRDRFVADRTAVLRKLAASAISDQPVSNHGWSISREGVFPSVTPNSDSERQDGPDTEDSERIDAVTSESYDEVELEKYRERQTRSVFRALRLDQGLAARLGLPLRPLIRRKARALPHRTIDVGGIDMAYRAEGFGRPVVLLGGCLGSMDMWLEVVPHLSSDAYVVSIDMIGFGYSGRLPDARPGSYDWDTHVGYLGECFDALGLRDDLTIVSHGYNSIAAIEWARTHPARVRAMSFADAVLRPMAWSEAERWLREAIKRARGDDDHDYFLHSDGFIDEAVKELAIDIPDPVQVDRLRQAFGEPGLDRLAHLDAIANLPIGGSPDRASRMMQKCYEWLTVTQIPKLLIFGRPGFILVRRGGKLPVYFPQQTIANVDGRHLLPASAPDAIGRFLNLWLDSV